MSLRKRIRVSLALTTVLLTSACSDSMPSTRQAERALRAVVDSGGSSLDFERFEKTDGESFPALNTSQLLFTAVFRFKKDAAFSAGENPFVESKRIVVRVTDTPSDGTFSWEGWLATASGFRRARAGDRLHLQGVVSFIRRESGWFAAETRFRVRHDSSARTTGAANGDPSTANSSPPPTRVSSGMPDSQVGDTPGAVSEVAARRCADDAREHPRAQRSIIDRLLRRAPLPSLALPDSAIILVDSSVAPLPKREAWQGPSEATSRLARFGSVALLPTGELCVGATPLANVLDVRAVVLEVSLSRPNAHGDRLLQVIDMDRGSVHAWVVNPDSTTPLSSDALEPFLTEGWAALGASFDALPSQWSPDRRRIALITPRASILLVPIGSGQPREVEIASYAPQILSHERCWLSLEPSSLKWSSAEVLRVRVGITQVSGAERCPFHADSVGVLLLDIARGSVARLR